MLSFAGSFLIEHKQQQWDARHHQSVIISLQVEYFSDSWTSFQFLKWKRTDESLHHLGNNSYKILICGLWWCFQRSLVKQTHHLLLLTSHHDWTRTWCGDLHLYHIFPPNPFPFNIACLNWIPVECVRCDRNVLCFLFCCRHQSSPRSQCERVWLEAEHRNLNTNTRTQTHLTLSLVQSISLLQQNIFWIKHKIMKGVKQKERREDI